MKKFILLLTFVAMTTFSFAQEKTSELVTDSNVEKLIDKYSAKLEASIISLAETLKQPAEYVYGTLLKQQAVKAWTNLLIGVLATLILIIVWILWFKDKKGKDEWWGVPTFITLGYIVFWCAVMMTIVGGFINPDYGAMQEIVNMIK